MPMFYTADIQDAVVREKMRLMMDAIAESIGDNDEAADTQNRHPEKLHHQDGFQWVVPCSLDYYSSTGSGTPLHDTLIKRLQDAQAAEWARTFPNRAGLYDVLAGDEDGEFRSDAEEWDKAALDDETIWIRIEVIRCDGTISFLACFMNEINTPYGKEYVEELDEAAFLALDGEALEKLGNRVAEAPYKATLD